MPAARSRLWSQLQTSPYAPSPVTVFLAVISLIVFGLVAIDQAAAATKAVAIKDFAFTPDKVSVAVGDTVTWTNKETDGTVHHVKFDDGAESTDIAPGKSYSRSFSKKGSYHYICSLHTYMEGTVTVGGGGSTSPSPKPSAKPSPTTVP